MADKQFEGAYGVLVVHYCDNCNDPHIAVSLNERVLGIHAAVQLSRHLGNAIGLLQALMMQKE